MNKTRLLFLFVSSISWFSAAADKIEKKGTLLNSNCQPIGTRCIPTSPSGNVRVTLTYVCHEPRRGSFSLELKESELMNYPLLWSVFKGQSEILLEEAMPVPGDVLQLLQWPDTYQIPKGRYALDYRNGCYSICIVK
jgi:hypothetical protein